MFEMPMNPIIILITAFFVKHYFADFQWQTPFMYLNKGKWGHRGGLYHSGIHAVLTLFIIAIWNVYAYDAVLTTNFIFLAAFFDFVIHYVTDLTKVNVCAKMVWSKMGKDFDGKECLNIYSNNYFLAFGIDQTIHALTYIMILSYII